MVCMLCILQHTYTASVQLWLMHCLQPVQMLQLEEEAQMSAAAQPRSHRRAGRRRSAAAQLTSPPSDHFNPRATPVQPRRS